MIANEEIRADYVLANPPFRFALRRTNFAWDRVARIIHRILRSLGEGGHLHLKRGMAGFVFANGPVPAGSSNQSGEGEIRIAIIEADLVDCMVALPVQLFYSTQKFSLN